MELATVAVVKDERRRSGEGTAMKRSPSELQFEQGLKIMFKDLTYTVDNNAKKGEKLNLLSNVSGLFQSGEMTALMGPSGSGKTTLLDVLAGRKTVGTASGTLLFGSTRPSKAFLRRFTGYVEQFDTLLGILTVEEMLLYTAEMKRPISESLASKKAAVEEVLDALGLTVCRDVKIGNPLQKGISGGQAKRTNIGIALMSSPRILFLDEPTSGLDSFTANEVMTVVKKLLSDGVTICCTIHSPTAYAFNLFDTLMMLTRGRVVYFGPQGQPAIDYALAAWPHDGSDAYKANGAEWLVDLITLADRDGRAAAFADIYAGSAQAKSNLAKLDVAIEEAAARPLPQHLQDELAVTRETVTPIWWGLKTLIKYRTPRNYKDPEFLAPRIGDKLLMTSLMWALYWGIGSNFAPNNYVNQSAVLFMWCVLPAYGAASYVPAIVLERALYTRERSDGLYYPITYLMAKMLDELMGTLPQHLSVGFSAAAFYAIDFQGNFGTFWLVYLLVLYIGVALAYFIAAISPNMDAANALLPVYVTTQLFFGGFILDFRVMPNYMKWLSYLDFIRYAWSALMVNQYSGPMGDPLWPGMEGRTVLEHYQLKNYHDHSSAHYSYYQGTVDKWANLGFLTIFFFGFMWAALMALTYKTSSAR